MILLTTKKHKLVNQQSMIILAVVPYYFNQMGMTQWPQKYNFHLQNKLYKSSLNNKYPQAYKRAKRFFFFNNDYIPSKDLCLGRNLVLW